MTNPAPRTWDRPYVVHTNRELELMLAGTKPLAHFCDVYPGVQCDEIIPLEAFAPYVDSGRFVTRQYVELSREVPSIGREHPRGTLHAFFARPSEEWRIDAYIQMMEVSAKIGWSEAFERLKGALLGYSESECDMHMDAVRASPVSRDWYWVRSK